MTRRAAVGAVAGVLAAGGTAVELLSRPDSLANRVAAAPGAPLRPSTPTSRAAVAQRPGLAAPDDDRDSSFVAGEKRRPKTTTAKSGVTRDYAGFAQAAKAGRTEPGLLVAKAGPLSTAQAQRHLLNRVTFGPRPADVESLRELGVDRWLAAQLSPTAKDPSGDQAWRAFKLAGADPGTIQRSITKYSWDAMFQTGFGTLGRQVFGRRQLFEVVVDVFANHLHVATPSDRGWDVAPGYATDVIRKHAFGRYADMLKAAMRHPAMLRYLDNDASTRESVNENLGRELLELHTVGVSSGYTEKDMRSSAYVLSGRGANEQGRFEYKPERHRTGRVKVLDWSAANTSGKDGLRMGDRYLDYLAKHPATARTIARKLVVRFVDDVPPPALVARLADVYLRSDTAILPVLTALFRSGEFWNSLGCKTKRPLEDVVSTARALDLPFGPSTGKGLEAMYWQLNNLGHAPLAWPSPNGYPDVAPAWSSAGQMLERWSSHRALSHGWWEGLKREKLPAELRPRPGDTYRAWFDRLGERLIGQRPNARQRSALATFVGAKTSARVDQGRMQWQAGHVVALVLDSPQFLAR
ncbi:Protein of unknown function DUF1800 [Kribbella flavida DSM 17836]|uniref:DUF1800 domain-containing protein n=1 Tax=Kribbella flavida (strain DSM 17836 / JCM 10339 / NBRC 14399) TaxID=479435 RepID=D2PU89_KRIFD|nr:DUF1800 domain-containing protein [Kribbella flavida]ADB35140.1 Protein of unknown function DUF1800 [Kribbella flavida DSM 17836]